MKADQFMENKAAVRFLISGIVFFFLALILEGIYQKPIQDSWLDIEMPFKSTKFDLVFDHENRDWFCSSEGVFILADGEWQSFTSENSELPGACNGIAIDYEDHIWVGTTSGLLEIDGQTWDWYTIENSGILSNEVCSVNTDQIGRVWVSYCGPSDMKCQDCLTGRISVFDGEEWRSFEVGGGPHAKTILIDYQGTVWLEDDLNMQNVRLYAIRGDEIEFDMLSGYSVFGICIGEDELLSALVSKDYEYSIFTYDGKAWNQHSLSQVKSLNRTFACSQDGRMAYGNNYDLWIKQGDKTIHFTNNNSPKYYYGLRNLNYDHQGNLWIGTQWFVMVLSSENVNPPPQLFERIRTVTFHPNSMVVFSLLLISLSISAWQGGLRVTAAVVAFGLVANVLLNLELRFMYGATYIILGVAGSLIGKEIQRRSGKGKSLPIILAIVGMVIGMFIDLIIIFMANL